MAAAHPRLGDRGPHPIRALLTVTGASAPPRYLRAYLREALRPGFDQADPAIEGWLDRSILSLSDLNRQILGEVEVQLGIGDNGTPLASSTANRYRKVSKGCIRRAVELEVIGADPWPPPVRGRNQRKAVRTSTTVNIRDLPAPASMVEILDAMISHQPASRTYRVMSSVAYYGGLRPSEVVMLRPGALELPASGWGRIHVVEADISFDEPGEPKTGPRSVPIPPVLVSLLSEWVAEGGYADDELIFRTRNGRRPTASNWNRCLKRAARSLGHPRMRVYDCRHAAATTWLRAGVPLGECARRLGHSVEVLVSTYVGAIEGDEAIANARIDAALAA